MNIAILEDDASLGEIVLIWLEKAGHTAKLFTSATDFHQAFKRESFDLLLFDRILPKSSGDEEMVWARNIVNSHIPVIFMTACATEKDIVDGLLQGADDYIVKPVKEQELLARIIAVIRRNNVNPSRRDVLKYPPYAIHLAARVIMLEGKEIKLKPKEFDLALLFFLNAERLLSRSHIAVCVWGKELAKDARTLDTHISNLRKKLEMGKTGWNLSSSYQHGYLLKYVGEPAE